MRFGFRFGSKAGQSMVLVALMQMALLAAVGIAIDAGLAYYYSGQAERAAAAGALAGVLYMPNQYSSTTSNWCSGQDAQDQARCEAQRNGFTDQMNNVTVTPATTAVPSQLAVTVTKVIPVFFMKVFGVPSLVISRTAIADQRAPVSIGQPGGQFGSTVSTLGTSSSPYFARELAWASQRSWGDAYTANPCGGWDSGSPASPGNPPAIPAGCTTDQHVYSWGTDLSDPTLPVQGGYNYLVTLPSGGGIQVYNAAFAPDWNGTKYNACENSAPGGAPMSVCNADGTQYNYWENDDIGGSPANDEFAAMRYTVFKVVNAYSRLSDVKLAQMTVLPINAAGWSSSPPHYVNVNTGLTITQLYAPGGAPINGQYYHSWMDVTRTALTNSDGIFSYAAGFGPLTGALPAGTYRLRVDALNWDGSMPPTPYTTQTSTAKAAKAYAVRAVDTSGSACTTCNLSPMGDAALFTPFTISGSSAGAFQIPLFALPSTYAGNTVDVDVWDPGDLSCSPGCAGAFDVTLGLINPLQTCSLPAPCTPYAPANAATPIKFWNCGKMRSTCDLNNGTGGTAITPSSGGIMTTHNGTPLYNGNWIRFEVPIDPPGTYNPAPGSDYWKLQYALNQGTSSKDTISLVVHLKGSPAHLISS